MSPDVKDQTELWKRFLFANIRPHSADEKMKKGEQENQEENRRDKTNENNKKIGGK